MSASRSEYPTADEQAERITAALLAPLQQVGELLAREVDALNVEVAELRGDIAELGVRVERLGVLVGDDEREHSRRAELVGDDGTTRGSSS